MRPTFLIIGAMKSGTTSLYRYLRDHPQIQMSTTKELHFFSEPQVWARGWEWYEAQFPERLPSTLAVGEASTSYTKFPELPGVPERIAEFLPDTRFIYGVRHPVERMRSHYLHRLGEGTETRPIDVALLEDETYVGWSLYAAQIERYLARFSRDRLLIITSDALRAERAATLSAVYGFVGVDSTWVDPVQDQEFYRAEDKTGLRPLAARARRNATLRRMARHAPSWLRRTGLGGIDTSKGQISPEVVRELEGRVHDDVARLHDYLDFDGWGIA